MTEIWDKTPKKNKDTGLWEIKVFTPEGVFLELKEYKSQSDAFVALKDYNKNNPNSPKNTAKAKAQQQGNFLEQAVDQYEDDHLNIDDPFDLKDAEAEQRFEEEYKSKITEAETEARGLLEHVANLYLDAKFVDSNEYLKYKLDLEQKGLSSLIFQVHVAQKAIYRLQKKMELGDIGNIARANEVLTQLIRASLDIAKFQHEYIDKLQESMKKFRVDMQLEGKISDDDITEDADGNTLSSGSGGGIVTNDRKKLLEGLNELMAEAENIKIPQSRNSKLHDDDPRVIEVEYTENNEWQSSGDDDMDDKDMGLNTYDEDESFED